MQREISILACELRKYTHEQLVQKLAEMSVRMINISAYSTSHEDAMDRADRALRNTGISEDIK